VVSILNKYFFIVSYEAQDIAEEGAIINILGPKPLKNPL